MNSQPPIRRAAGAKIRAALACALAGTALAPTALGLELCMLPAATPFEKSDERVARVEQMLTDHLAGASIRISSSAEVQKLLDDVDARSGAIFDPATGRIDAERNEAFLDDIERSVRERFGCDGFVRVGLAQVLAWYNGVSANWDGQRAQVNSGARIAGQVLLAALGGVILYEEGWVGALSLFVEVETLRFEDVAFRSAGIETLQDFSISRGHDLLPPDRWLRDDDVLKKSIEKALGEKIELLETRGRPAGSRTPDFEWH